MAKFKDAALKEILAEVEGEIASLLKSEKQKLAKAAEESAGGEGSPAEASASGGDSGAGGPPSAGGAGGAQPSPSAPPAGPDMGAPPAGGPAGAPPGAAGAPADPAAAGGGDMGAPPTLEELAAEYAKLPPEELKMHYLAAKTALFQVMGAADGGAGAGAPGGPGAGGPPGAAPSPSPSAPPAGASPSASPAGAPGMGGDVPPAPPAMKGEMPWGSKTEGNDERASDSNPKPTGTGQTKPVVSSVTKGSMPWGGKTVGNDEGGSDSNPTPTGTGQTKPVVSSVTKSESEELADLRKGQEQIAKVLEALLTIPERKAWTGTEIQYIKKSEMPTRESKPLKKSLGEFTVSDVNAKLNEITRNPKLAKSDRERINQYYANQIDLDGIKDLLIGE